MRDRKEQQVLRQEEKNADTEGQLLRLAPSGLGPKSLQAGQLCTGDPRRPFRAPSARQSWLIFQTRTTSKCCFLTQYRLSALEGQCDWAASGPQRTASDTQRDAEEGTAVGAGAVGASPLMSPELQPEDKAEQWDFPTMSNPGF